MQTHALAALASAASAGHPPQFIPTAVQDYPRIANLYGLYSGTQFRSYARFGLVMGPGSDQRSFPGAAGLKARSPGTKCLVYYEALLVVVPGFNAFSIYPGWWLCMAGTTLNGGINASTTSIAVTSAAALQAWATYPDILIDNESMTITGVVSNTLTVIRGVQSTAASHITGAMVRQHTYGGNAWGMNASSYCPRNEMGWQWSDALAHMAATKVRQGIWDGVFYDSTGASFAAYAGGAVDANNDNVADGGDGPSGTGWRDGMTKLFAVTRALLPQALIMGNSGVYPGGNGMEMEQLEYYGSWDYTPGGTGGAAYSDVSEMTALVQTMTGSGALYPLSITNPDTDSANFASSQYARMRWGLALALMGNGYYAFDGGPNSGMHAVTWWYDEYDGGQGSCLASAINNSVTSLTVYAGTGGRFSTGDTIYVPDDANGDTSDDEQMYVSNVSTDTLTVTRGYNGSYQEAHAAGQKVMTLAHIKAGQGWLGKPLGAATINAQGLSTLAVTNGDFETASVGVPTSWTLSTANGAAATWTQETSLCQHGSNSGKVVVTVKGSSSATDVEVYDAGVAAIQNGVYSWSFWMRSPTILEIGVLIQDIGTPYTIYTNARRLPVTNNWTQYVVRATPTQASPHPTINFCVGQQVGTLYVDNVVCYVGDAGVWRREFTNGVVLLNATAASQTVSLSGTFHYISGTQAPSVNTGALVSSAVVPTMDARVIQRG